MIRRHLTSVLIVLVLAAALAIGALLQMLSAGRRPARAVGCGFTVLP